jgi:hypothetical protein
MFRPAELVERIRRLVHGRPAGHQRDGGRLMIRVLCIEDNDDNGYMLKMRLELLASLSRNQWSEIPGAGHRSLTLRS